MDAALFVAEPMGLKLPQVAAHSRLEKLQNLGLR
jgi:hypothetical protein